MKKTQSGFSLVELLVVIGVVGILAAVLFANFAGSSAVSRDAKRQADVRLVSVALESYKSKYGRYPEGCNGAGAWSGHADDYDCPSGNQYIVGLAPEFISRLPQDPRLNGDDSGYTYLTNTDGTVYKFMVARTVESEVVDYNHEFKICDTDNTASLVPICAQVRSFSNSRPTHCNQSNSTFQTSYAVWGGYASPNINATIGSTVYNRQIDEGTEDIVCVIPS
jgi:prepilin-type N-terminal cleavage/methylation domain-containing protein